MAKQVTLPNGWRARDYQIPLWKYLRDGGKRAICCWHRRAGKDDVLLHATACAAMERPANYWHMLPQFAQCRKAIWDAVSAHTGKRRIFEAFPQELITNMNDTEMKIRFVNGSTWQLVGSDHYNNLVGAGVAGATFSEYALANPSAYAYIRPMLEENNGWAAFISTPRGKNHFWEMIQNAHKRPGWFSEVLSITDTRALSPEQVASSRQEYIDLYGDDMGEALFEQEYLCSFTAAIMGAFYGRELTAVRNEGRLCTIEAVPGVPVHTSWDLGISDDTALWHFQVVGAQILILGCHAQSGVGLDYYENYMHEIHSQKCWVKGVDFVPHDARAREWTGGRTRIETMMAMGFKPELVPNVGLMDGINAARRTLPLCIFDSDTEMTGFSALESYKRKWDDNKKAFSQGPDHDWASHYADSFRYLALSWRRAREVAPAPVDATIGMVAEGLTPPPLRPARRRR
ncbi:hypothetical protein [Gluconobacter albidus]|uniref:hypothetical protein n=1 Tax=Gluconobacter albidus TaxID=318683 RepID=UPI000781BD0D|nr:hypothetical protein [Gluconobacter albidus]